MKSKYAVRWRRSNGQSIAIEQMTDGELVAALRALEREDFADPIAALLYDAVAEESQLRAGEYELSDQGLKRRAA